LTVFNGRPSDATRFIGGVAGARPALLHARELYFQFARVPSIVAVEKGDVSSRGGPYPGVAGTGHTLVHLHAHRHHSPVGGRALLDQLPCAIARAIVDDDEFQMGVGLLQHRTHGGQDRGAALWAGITTLTFDSSRMARGSSPGTTGKRTDCAGSMPRMSTTSSESLAL
jgi:hypothetical protein